MTEFQAPGLHPVNNLTTQASASWSYTSPDVVSQRLKMMVGASADLCDHAADLSSVMRRSTRHANNRSHAIKWIKEVVGMSEMSMDARDTSVQIFDRYFGRHLLHDPTAFDNSETFSTVAAVSVLLSSKFHESRPLSMSSFSSFTPDVLSAAENRVLLTLDYNIVPLATPTSFIQHMLLLWPNLEADSNFLATVTEVACKLIGEFWECAASCRCAPSTIALAALLLAFSSLHMDCSRWLSECVPDSCLPGDKNTVFPASGQYLLDIDGCLLELQKWCCSRRVESPVAMGGEDKEISEMSRLDSSSPVSITDTFPRSSTPLAETAALSLADEQPLVAQPLPHITRKQGESLKSKRIKLF